LRARLSAALQRQLERLGLRSAAQLRQQAHQDFARRFGLPEDVAPRAVLIVLLCNATKTSYLGDLQQRGLLARIHRRSDGPDAGRLPDLYLLTPLALELLSATAHPTEEETDHARER
jgi:hypothetical protein